MMKLIPICAGAALLAFTSPAIAKPDKGHGHGNVHASKHGNAHAKHGRHGQGIYYGYGKGGCPPGLARKGNGCMPRGQVKKMYRVGQRYPGSYGAQWSYNQIPYDLRQRYDLDRSNRYYYGNGYLYQVDPRTRLVEQVVSALLR